MNRRHFLAASSSIVFLAGCASDNDEPQDSDGDGVPDSEDYAPRDSDVQEKEDVASSGTKQPDSTVTRTHTETITKTPTVTVTGTATPTQTQTTFGEMIQISDALKLTITDITQASMSWVSDGEQGVRLHAEAHNTSNEAVNAPYWGDFLLFGETEQWAPANFTTFDSDRLLAGKQMSGWIGFSPPQSVDIDSLSGAYFPNEVSSPYTWHPR